MIYQDLLVIALFILVYSMLAIRLEKTILNGPLLAMLFGLLAGPSLFELLNIKVSAEAYRVIAELALALVLFTDAANTNQKVLDKNIKIPARLLLIGLPLTILFGGLAGFMIFKGYSWIELGILATMLAPTDAALGKAVVTNPKVPSKIRESLNVESGLNDGISVPILFLLMALFESSSGSDLNIGFGLGLFVKEIGIGLIVGLVLTYLGIRLANFASKKGWISSSWKTLIIIALAFSCFTLAQISGGSGFIACFTGGLLYGRINKKYKLDLLVPAEGAGDMLSLITWLIFGSMIIALFAPHFTWEVILYALLSLTIIRMLPVAISLIGTKIKTKEVLFMGWFGPRGLASIVFAIIILDIHLPHKETIILAVACTIMMSIVLHGITANPFINSLKNKEA
jgi:NhaP-type Na+/H+ or K+/H+ antiporter